MMRNISLDILKLTLAFFVVGIHTSFFSDISLTGCYLTINGLFRIAVPIFLIINGFYFANLIDHPLNWFKRVLLLYVFWMLIYSYFWFQPGTDLFAIAKFLKTLVVGYEHLWYLPGMMGAALILYLLRKLPSHFLLLAAMSLFAIGATLQYAGNYHWFGETPLDKVANTLWIYRSALFFAFPFFCLGYWLRLQDAPRKLTLTQAAVMMVASIFLILAESYWNYRRMDHWEGFDIFYSLFLVCPAIFLFFIKLNISGTQKTLALYSTGIYFSHFLLIFVLRELTNAQGTLLTLYVSVAAVTVSFFLIRLNRKLKCVL